MLTRERALGALMLAAALGCSVDARMPVTRGQPTVRTPTPIFIDTFESGNAQPDDARFNHWEFYTYNPALTGLPPGAFAQSPMVRPGYGGSAWCLGTDWQLIDV